MIKHIKEYAQTIVVIMALLTAIGSGATWTFTNWSTWSSIPDKVETLQESQTEIKESLGELTRAIQDQKATFDILDVLSGGATVTQQVVTAGAPLHVTYQVRANADCDRDILIRYFNHDLRTFHWETSTQAAVKSAVSDDFQVLNIQAPTFASMPPGRYSYAPVIRPINCGVYKEQELAFSNPFTVVAHDPDN